VPTTYLVACRVCHLLIRSPYQSVTTCDVCAERLTERAEAQERLDRQHERHCHEWNT
jgi:hypothetical protein